MFSKLKNFFDNQPPSPPPPETPPNPLYAMLAADTAAMEAGKKTSKIRAAWKKHFETYSVAACLPYFYDFLLENIDAALAGRLKDGTGLHKFTEALASDKIDLLRKYPEDLQFPNEIRKPNPKKRQGIQTAHRCNARPFS